MNSPKTTFGVLSYNEAINLLFENQAMRRTKTLSRAQKVKYDVIDKTGKSNQVRVFLHCFVQVYCLFVCKNITVYRRMLSAQFIPVTRVTFKTSFEDF